LLYFLSRLEHRITITVQEEKNKRPRSEIVIAASGVRAREAQPDTRQAKRQHRIWKSPMGARLPVQEANGGKAKGYQVKQFLSIREEEAQ
jgi:hypothetical protein